MKRAQHEIMEVLYTNIGQIVTYERLRSGKSRSTIQSHVSFIREAMKEAQLPYCLLTVPDEGYQLIRADL